MEENESKLEWWGYIHENGDLIIKRYLNDMQIIDALESDFVKTISGRVYAKDKKEATELIKKELLDEL